MISKTTKFSNEQRNMRGQNYSNQLGKKTYVGYIYV